MGLVLKIPIINTNPVVPRHFGGSLKYLEHKIGNLPQKKIFFYD